MASWLDDSRAVQVLELPDGYTYEELDSQFTHLEHYYQKLAEESPDARVGLVVDLRSVRRSSSRNRARIARALRDAEPALERVLVAQAYVVGNQAIRGALLAIFWLRPPAWPVGVFTNSADAERWVQGYLPDPA